MWFIALLLNWKHFIPWCMIQIWFLLEWFLYFYFIKILQRCGYVNNLRRNSGDGWLFVKYSMKIILLKIPASIGILFKSTGKCFQYFYTFALTIQYVWRVRILGIAMIRLKIWSFEYENVSVFLVCGRKNKLKNSTFSSGNDDDKNNKRKTKEYRKKNIVCYS